VLQKLVLHKSFLHLRTIFVPLQEKKSVLIY
jgi:hypothetical protein